MHPEPVSMVSQAAVERISIGQLVATRKEFQETLQLELEKSHHQRQSRSGGLAEA